MVECVCRAARGSPDHLLTPLIIPQKCPNRSGNIRLLRAVGRLQRRSRGLAYISIALLFEIQQRVSTRATPRRSCQHSLLFIWGGFDEKLREEAMISSGEVKNTLHNSGAPTFQERFGSVDASTLPASFRILSLWSSMVCILFPLVRCWAVWPSASVHSQSLSSSFALSLSLPLQKRQIWRRSTEPTRAKMSRSEVDELIYFQRPFSRVQVNLAEPENLLAFVTLLNGPVANGDALLMRWICSVDSAPLLRGNSGEIFSVSELKTDT